LPKEQSSITTTKRTVGSKNDLNDVYVPQVTIPPPKSPATKKETIVNNSVPIPRSPNRNTETAQIPIPVVRSPKIGNAGNNRDSDDTEKIKERLKLIAQRRKERLRGKKQSRRQRKKINNSKRKVKKIILKEWQVKWSKRAYDILQSNHGYIDTSKMGSGKTFIVLWLCLAYGLSLIVIGPKIVLEKWRQTANEYGVNILKTISYQSLRTVKGKQPKHGLLHRQDGTIGGVKRTKFDATKNYYNLLKEGVMVVCDEFQLIKNNNDQYKACLELVSAINFTGGESRYALISGTPISEEHQIINVMRLLGYVSAPRLYHVNPKTKKIVLDGMKQIINTATQIDAAATLIIINKFPPINRDNIIHACYTLYTDVIKETISGSMEPVIYADAKFDIKNGFYDVGTDRDRLRKAVKALMRNVNYDKKEDNNLEPIVNPNLALMKLLVEVENSKVEGFVRKALEVLKANNRNKVIISLNYTSTLYAIYDKLLDYDPLILNGDIKKDIDRWETIYEFNNDPDMRVLLMNTEVGGIGIDLHDTDGRYPRFMFISPSYKMINIVQAADRIYRTGSKSDATVRVFYGSGKDTIEMNILNALARKSIVTKGVLDKNNNTVFPSDYASEFD
jgi:hypothetical protein